jgi:hypothetical protein
VDPGWFERVYVIEDGPVEWATAAALLAAAGVSVWTVRRPGAGCGRLHAVTWVGLALLCLFAAGEEISWGQRVLGFSSPELFVRHNAQHETNLHNMVVAGVKVNKLVFSQLLFVCARCSSSSCRRPPQARRDRLGGRAARRARPGCSMS